MDPRTPAMSRVALKHARILRGPSQLAFDITNRCNLRCLHCYNRSGENQVVEAELDDSEVLMLSHDIATLKPLNVCFCGGEPLLRFEALCAAAAILEQRSVRASMVTNGLLLDEERARKLKRSGIQSVQVSLDGSVPENHDRLRRRPGAFEGALRAIRILVRTGFASVSVAFAPNRWNCDELGPACRLLKAEGVPHVRVQPLMLLGRALETDDLAPTPLQYRRLVRDIAALRGELGMRIEWGDPIDHLVRFRTVLRHCITFCGIRADGKLTASAYLPLVVGDVRRHRLTEYWEAGLARIWELPQVKAMASRISSVADMGVRHPSYPVVWRDLPIELDLIEQAGGNHVNN